MKKIIVNNANQIFLTDNAVSILKQLEVDHPAGKMLVIACKMQQEQFGDATNFAATFAGQLLSYAEDLIKEGFHPSQIITGYQNASNKALQLIEKLDSYKIQDVRNIQLVSKALKAIIAKFSNHEQFFVNLIAKACINSLSNIENKFNIDNIKVIHILGSSLQDSLLMSGMAIKRNVEGSIQKIIKSRIAVYNCSLNTNYSQTRGAVLISNAVQLLNYSRGEQLLAESFVRKLFDTNINTVIVNGTISDISLYYLDKYKILVIRILSEFELRRIARAVKATVLSKLQIPTQKKLDRLIKKNTFDCKLHTIVLRGYNKSILRDIQKVINAFRLIVQDSNFVPGAGSTQIILSIQLQAEAKKLTGLNRQSYNRYGKAFEVFPRILAQNAGLNPNEIISKMIISANKNQHYGLNILSGQLENINKLQIYDHRKTKQWAIRLASQTAITILRIDQIIIAKPSRDKQIQ